MNKNLLFANGKESLLLGSMVILKSSNRQASAYFAAKMVAEIVCGTDCEDLGHTETTGMVLCFMENISLSWLGKNCLDAAVNRLGIYPASVFKDGWSWGAIKKQIELNKPELVVVDYPNLDSDEVAKTAKEMGCCIVMTSDEASGTDQADEVFEVSVGDDWLLDVNRTKGGELSLKMKATSIIDDCVVRAVEKVSNVSSTLAELRNVLLRNRKEAKCQSDRLNAKDAIDELMQIELHLSRISSLLNGEGTEDTTISDRYDRALSCIEEFRETVLDELLSTENVDALSYLSTAKMMINDAKDILERAYLYADGKQRGECIRVILSSFGEYFLADWTATERRVTGMPMPLDHK